MKKLEKINLILLIAVFPLICWGENFGFVNSVKGKVFLIDKYGNTKLLKRGDGLEVNSQVFVEEKGQLTFADYNDRQYDLASEAHIKVEKRQLEVSKGYLRVKSKFTTNKTMTIITSNSQTKFTSGEAILSYDPSNGSTQLLSIDGTFDFKNTFLQGSKIEVYGGQFSSIQGDRSGGQPTTPAKIGENSLNLAMSEFYVLEAPSRTISSVKKPKATPGKIIFIPRNGRKKQAKPQKLQEKTGKSTKATPVKVHIFGQKSKKKVKDRNIASEEGNHENLMRDLKAVK